MANDYIPLRDADYDIWLYNFSTLLTASPATYGLLAGDATTVAAQYTTWHAAYLLAVNPATRTPVTVAAKDVARVVSMSTVRPYAQRIATNSGVSASDKIAIGVNPRTNVPTPIPAPTTQPVLSLPSAMPGQIVLRYRDQLASPSVKAKPFGVTGLELHVQFGTVTTDPSTWPLYGIQTKSPSIVSFGSEHRGIVINFAGRWLTRTGLVGPFSPTVAQILT